MKKPILIAAALLSLGQAHAVNGILNGVMATINKNAQIEGPIYRHESRDQDQYGDKIATIILQEAHRQAKRFLDEGNHKAYNAFIALSLTVPNQEGLMVHFREVESKRSLCNDDRSQGKNIKSSKAKRHFQKALNSGDDFLVPCRKLRREKTYRQLIVGGSDGSDVGIMQVSALWHYDEFLSQGKYTSVRSTVRYGLSYHMRRYKKLVRTYGNESCFFNAAGGADYLKIARGTWSAYNGGPSQLCRFADKDSAFAGHDKGFKGNLQKTLNLNNGGYFGFNQEGALKLSPSVKNAISEVITSVETGSNNQRAMRSILN